MAYSELPWRPFLGHQAWSWTTLRRGNVLITFTNVFLIFVTFFTFFNVFYFYLNVFYIYEPNHGQLCSMPTFFESSCATVDLNAVSLLAASTALQCSMCRNVLATSCRSATRWPWCGPSLASKHSRNGERKCAENYNKMSIFISPYMAAQ